MGAFRFEPVQGAAANALSDQVPEEVKEERFSRLMQLSESISNLKLKAKVGQNIPVIIDEIGQPDEDGDVGATGRSKADAPEIDGMVYLRGATQELKTGDIIEAHIEESDTHDLYGLIL